MDNGLFKQALDSVELVDIYLNQSNISREDDFTDQSPLDGVSQQTKLSLKAQILEDLENTDTPDMLKAYVDFSARYMLKGSSSDKEKILAEIDAQFVVMYVLKKKIPDEAIQVFVEKNVVHNTWPFWREHLLRTTATTKLPRFVVPLNKNLTMNVVGSQED